MTSPPEPNSHPDTLAVLDIGIPELDADHRELFTLYFELMRSLAEQQDAREFANAFKTLIDRTREHFEREEQYMRDHDFPEYDQHKQEHDKLAQDAEDFVHSVSNRYDAYDCPAVGRYFWYWLTSHVMRCDRKIAEFIRGGE